MSNVVDHPAQPLTLEGLHRELLALRDAWRTWRIFRS